MQHEIVLQMVEDVRKVVQWRKTGTDKLHRRLQPEFSRLGIRMGRVALNDLLREYGLLVRKRRKRVVTTNSFHHFRKYDNLIKGLVPDRAGLVWVSDITYIEAGHEFAYLFLITDQYSHKIIGHSLSLTLQASGAINALNMALLQHKPVEGQKLIHHSDRGIQYCCKDYVNTLNKSKIQISMAARGNPYENAVAERVNGILKDEMGLDRSFTNFEEALRETIITINMYNNERQHKSIDNLFPSIAHSMTGLITKRW